MIGTVPKDFFIKKPEIWTRGDTRCQLVPKMLNTLAKMTPVFNNCEF
jgi:hypothetical protein